MTAGWECQVLPMLSLPVKESGKASFLAIKPMIAAHYEENPDSFHDEIRQLDQLREGAMRPSKDYNGISVLRRYFAQLHLMRARFPPETIGHLPIDFVWKDMFSGVEYVQDGLQMEQASVLYNISAFHSILACRSKRDVEQDIKDSITHFQCAAGAFNYLDEKLSLNHASKDLNPQFIRFYKNLMLGQAQECFVEKSLRVSGSVKCVTIAKLAARVADYYTETTICLETEPCDIIFKKNKDWPKLLRVKMFYFQAISHFYQGGTCEETGQHGAMMAWYQLTLKKLGAMGKIPKTLLGENVREIVKSFSEYVQARLGEARKQNERVYHDRTPDLETLEPISGTDLVKPVTFQPTDSKNLGTDIFGRLVPMRAYEASSIYSEKKAELLRSINSSVTEKDDELEKFMRTLNVGEIEKINEGPPELPGEVLEQHRSLQGKSMLVKKLHSDLQELMDFSAMVTKDLSDINEHRVHDDQEEEEFQSRFGSRPISQVCTGMWKELDSLRAYHDQGSKSNSDLKAMFDQHYRYMVLLSSPISSLQAAIPKMTPMDAPEEDAKESDRWRDLQAKVKDMTTQRGMLVGQLREQMSTDDITKHLIGHVGIEADTFIEERMKKHREFAEIVRRNLEAQDNILSAVVDANATNARVRQAVQDLTELQDGMFSSLISSGKRYAVLQGKIREGLVFYSRLHENVSKLMKRVFDITGTRSRERENARRSHTPTSPSLPSLLPTTAPPPRPPKKAELAGNPLNPSIPDDQLQSVDTSKQVLDGIDQEFQQRRTKDSGDLINSTSPQRDLGLTTPTSASFSNAMLTNMPNKVVPTVTPLSMEEQLRALQVQHQLQLQSLGMGQHPATANNEGKEQEMGLSQDHVTTVSGHLPSDPAHMTTFMNDLSTSKSLVSSQESGNNLALAVGSSLDVSLVSTESSVIGILPQGSSGGKIIPQGSMGGILLQGSSGGGILPQGSSGSGILPHGSSGSGILPQGSFGGGILPQGSSGGGILPQGSSSVGILSQGSSEGNVCTHSGSPFTQSSEDKVSLKERQVLLDLQLLLQPPDEVVCGSSLPHPPELNTCLQDSVPGVSNTGTVPASGMAMDHSNALEPQDASKYLPIQSLNLDRSSVSPVNTIDCTNSVSPSLPSNASNQMQLHANVAVQDHGKGDSLDPLDRSSTENLTNLGVLSPSHTLDRSGREVREERSPGSVTQSVMGGIGLTGSTTNSDPISRPIPTPVLCPPTTPQMAEYGQNLTAGDMLISAYSKLTSPEDLPGTADESLHQIGKSILILNKCNARETCVDDRESNFGEKTGDNSDQMASIENTSADLIPRQNGLCPTLKDSSGSLSTSQHCLSSYNSISTPDMVPISDIEMTQHGIDTDLQSLHLSGLSLHPIPGLGSMSLQSPQSISSINLDLGLTQLSNTMEHLQALLASNRTLQLSLDEKTKEVEQNRAMMADQKSQLENYKQQLLILQQQLGQVSSLQQKQEQEKATASGQQAVLMQLLQQQQGMFSQQQAQIEKLSKVTDSHRREQIEAEMKYKQAAAVEQEKNSGLNSQNFQKNQEIQRLQQQLQSSAQQQQMVQVHLYQYQTQIQERDKQLLAFRDQHKQIIQSLELRYQQKVAQMVQQIHELQGELKKVKSHKHSRSPHPSNSVQQLAGTNKSSTPSPVPARQFPQVMSPVTLQPSTQGHPQQFVQSPMSPSQGTPISAHPTGVQGRQADLLTPNPTQSVHHQIPPLLPTKLQSPYVPSVNMGGTATQLAANHSVSPQLPAPMTPQVSPGVMNRQGIPLAVSQANLGHQQQSSHDGMIRSISWNTNQQHPAAVPQGNQQQFHLPGHPHQQQSMPEQQKQLQQQLQHQKQQQQQLLQQQQQQHHPTSQQGQIVPPLRTLETPQQQLAQGQQQHLGGQGFLPIAGQQILPQPQLTASRSAPTDSQGITRPVQGMSQQPSSSQQPNAQPVQHQNLPGPLSDGQAHPSFNQQQLQPHQVMPLGQLQLQQHPQQAYQQMPQQGFQQQPRH